MYKQKQCVKVLDFSLPLLPESIREMEKHTIYDQKNPKSHFDEIAPNYDAI
jgi:hypothetical protein